MQGRHIEFAVVGLLLIGIVEEVKEVLTGYWLAAFWLVLLLVAAVLAAKVTNVEGRTLLPVWVEVLVFVGSTEIFGGFLAHATLSGLSTVVETHPLLAAAVPAVIGALVLNLIVVRRRLTISGSG